MSENLRNHYLSTPKGRLLRANFDPPDSGPKIKAFATIGLPRRPPADGLGITNYGAGEHIMVSKEIICRHAANGLVMRKLCLLMIVMMFLHLLKSHGFPDKFVQKGRAHMPYSC